MDPADLARLLVLRDASRRVPFCPQLPHPKQRQFLAHPARELLFGGEAGGAKSSALCMDALGYVERPNYVSLTLRKTYKDLAKPGAIMDRSHQWLRGTKAHWDGINFQWRFPSTARWAFGHCETDRDRFNYQGMEAHRVQIDELTQWSEIAYRYINSRLRKNVGDDIPIAMRAGTNPGGIGHKWVMGYFGIRENGTQKDSWQDTEEKRTVTKEERPFMRSSAADNPSLDLEDYRKSLALLDSTTRAQLEKGLWLQDSQKRIYPYDADTHDVPRLPTHTTVTLPSGIIVNVELEARGWHRVFIVDLGSSTQDRTTSLTRLAYHDQLPDHVYVEFSKKVAGMIPSSIAKECELQCEDYGDDLTIVFDEGALGSGYGGEMRSRYGIAVIPAVKREKRTYMRLLKGAIESGFVHCVERECADLVEEAESLVFDERGLDEHANLANHCCDGLLYGWRWTYAHRSQAPSSQPAVGTDEWFRAEEEKRIDAEYERAKRRREESPWASPSKDDW